MRIENVDVIASTEFEFNFEKKPINHKSNNDNIIKEFATFDIETSSLPEIKQSFMYIWQMYINGVVVIGRTWSEFRDFVKRLHEYLGNYSMVIYVHNLSFEFMFLSGIYEFKNEDVFAVDVNKVLYCKMLGNIIFRCSYLLSNMSLSEYTNKMNVEHKKLTGDLDYGIIRYNDTELTQTELSYCVNDVVGLKEAIEKELEISCDTLVSIPYTSTGYVRRDARKAMYKYKWSLIKKIYPTYPIYQYCREEFRGGNTHANRYYAGIIVENVESDDRSSSYPDVINNHKFPITRFKEIGQLSISELENIINKDKKACLFRIVFENIRLKDDLWGFPYISIDKSRGLNSFKDDNGRILEADILEITLNDIDYDIIKNEYEWDNAVVKSCATANYGDIPKDLKDVVIKYYKSKTELKDIEGQEVYYTKEKNKLNSVYGMMAQNPVKQPIVYDGVFEKNEQDEQYLLNEYEKTAFLPYQWACWVTAWARWELEEGLKLAGYNAIYCDTDSVKHFGKIDFSEYNTKCINASFESGSHATDKKGNEHYMGVYESEHGYKRFITFGAKKYAYEYHDGKLGITIAGVGKKAGAIELESKGGLESLKEGFVFKEAGGMTAYYNMDTFGKYYKDGNELFITRNVYLEPSTYTLSLRPKYRELLNESHAKALDSVCDTILRGENYHE